MQRALSFPVTVERSRTKERLEASLAGLCELELRRQRQECLVLGALALGEPLAQDGSRRDLECFSSWGQENLTLRRQLSALHSSSWGLMQALEQQVGDLKIDINDGCCEGDTGDSQSNSGFYDSNDGQSPKGKSSSAEPTESAPSWTYINDRPKSLGDSFMLNGEFDVPLIRPNLPRSFSAPHPPLKGIVEEGSVGDSWGWDTSIATWQQQPAEHQITEEDYQQAFRVEGYILSLIQRYALLPRPCQPRTTLTPDPPYSAPSGHSSQHRRTPSLTKEQRLPDPHSQPHVELSSNLKSQEWGYDLPDGEFHRAEAPSFEEGCYLPLSYPQSRPNPLTGRLPSPLPSLEPNCGDGNLDLCYEPPSPKHYLHPQPSVYQVHNLVSAQYIPGQASHAPVRSPRHYKPEQSKANRATASPDQPNSKSRAHKKSHNDRQKSKKANSKTNRSQSENSLPGQRVVPERKCSTTERRPGRINPSQNQSQVTAPQVPNKGHSGSRRWCSNLELSQDENEIQNAVQAHKRSSRKARHGHSCSQSHSHQQNTQRWHQDCQARAPLCHSEESYVRAAPAESESSMSEVYSPPSSSLSSDSDESGGLVWPQQLPPRLASTSSSSSASPQATASAAAQPKAFVKIKASHALKKKILRFRTGSLKVMTTV